jgi:glycosyltransferase involved in cell wall biosynthesis
MRLIGVHRIHYRKGGAESVHLDHLRLFRAHGWTCAEFAMAHPDNEPSDFSSYFPPNFDPGAGSVLHRIASIPRFLHAPEAAAGFDRLLADFKPDVIHIHGLYQQLTTSVLAPALKRGIPTVYTLHDFKPVCPAYHLFNPRYGVCEKCRGGRQYNMLLNRCSGEGIAKDAVMALDGLVQWHTGALRNRVKAFVAPSRFLADKLIELGLDAARMHYVPNFFETTDDAPVADSDVDAVRARHGRFVLYFGRLSQEKGLEVLIRAAAERDFRLVLAGDGPQRSDLERLSGDLKADVTFAGHLRGGALWSHVLAAGVITLPSIWYENAPKSILEAQARGRVVVVSAIGGLPEMVEDGVTGFLARPGDVGHLGQMIENALSLEPDAAARIGAAARASANSTFTSERYFTEMSALYARLTA